jgi:hypothetical protein
MPNCVEGDRFGRLVVIQAGDAQVKFKLRKHLCQCDCGTVKMVGHNALTLKHGGTKSCGCKQKETIQKHRMLPGIQGIINRLMYTLRRSAMLRDLPVEITKAEFEYLIRQNCHYCGCEPDQTRASREHRRLEAEFDNFKYHGLDRVNSDRGYTLDNVVTCCTMCNRMKRDYTYAAFTTKIKTIAVNLATKVSPVS